MEIHINFDVFLVFIAILERLGVAEFLCTCELTNGSFGRNFRLTNRIVIVDDSAIDRRLVEFFLKKGIADVTLLSVENGEKAIAAIASETPDLIITDLQMPGMNGLELVEQIKSQGCSAPVILMTGFGTQQIAIQALKAGATSYVPKSALDKHLVETVKHVLSVSHWQRNQSQVPTTLDVLESHFTLENDPSLISPLIAYLQDQLETMRHSNQLQITRIGMAIYESLTYAIFHGNLELDTELRQGDEAIFCRLVVERRRDEPYASRRVRLSSRFSGAEARFIVSDDGSGTKPLERPNSIGTINLEGIEGRGTLLIHSFMDEVTHNLQGNEITMVKRGL